MNHQIPPMTGPLGRYWKQPARERSDASGYTTDAAGVVQPPLAWLIEDGAGYRGLTFVDPQTAEGAWDGFTITPLFAASPEALLRQALDVLERLIALQWPLEDASTSDGCYTDDPAEQQARAALAALRQALGGKA